MKTTLCGIGRYFFNVYAATCFSCAYTFFLFCAVCTSIVAHHSRRTNVSRKIPRVSAWSSTCFTSCLFVLQMFGRGCLAGGDKMSLCLAQQSPFFFLRPPPITASLRTTCTGLIQVWTKSGYCLMCGFISDLESRPPKNGKLICDATSGNLVLK